MIKRSLITFSAFLILLAAAFALFVTFAYQPGLSPEELPPRQILRFPQYADQQANPLRLKVATFNMGYASGNKNNKGRKLTQDEAKNYLDDIGQALEKLDADVLLIQEIDFYSWRSFDQNQLLYLAHRLKMPYAAYAINWNKNYVAWPYWPPTRHFGRVVSGQAILSRWPLSEQAITTLPKPQGNPFWYNWFYIDRLVQQVNLQWLNQEVSLYNVHLEAFDHPTRIQHLQSLTTLIKQDTHPNKLVGGDFNCQWTLTNPKDLTQREQQQILQGLMEQTNLKMVDSAGGHLTFPSWDPQKDLDYLFYSETFSEINSAVLKNLLASDHLLRWASFKK